MPNFATSDYTFCTRQPYYKNKFGVFLCDTVKAVCFKFMMVHSAKHREYQLVAKSTVPCFLTRVIFTMSIFSTVVCPTVPPELGAQRKLGGTLKKFPAL